MGARFVRMARWWGDIPLHALMYPGLAKRKRLRVVARISDPAYQEAIVGLEFGDRIAWVYEKHTTEAR